MISGLLLKNLSDTPALASYRSLGTIVEDVDVLVIFSPDFFSSRSSIF
jgi:hypothetical protein